MGEKDEDQTDHIRGCTVASRPLLCRWRCGQGRGCVQAAPDRHAVIDDTGATLAGKGKTGQSHEKPHALWAVESRLIEKSITGLGQ